MADTDGRPPDTRHGGAAWWASGAALVAGVALVRLLLYLLAAPNHGYGRDELYYLACGEHPAWGYVDQPPLVGWVAWLLQHTIGTSLYALRLLPALSGVAVILLAGRLARELGGGRWAMLLAALASLLGPVFLATTHVYSMNAFELPLWTLLALLLVRIEETGEQKLWLAAAAVLGIALLDKYTVAFFATALLLGVLVTPMRRSLLRPWFWLGGGLAALIALPNFLWQRHWDYPFLQLMRNLRLSGRDIQLAPVAYLGDQTTLIGWAATPLVLLAVVHLLAGPGRRFAFLGWGFLFMLVAMVVLHGKGPYLAPTYPVVFAAGASLLEEITGGRRLSWLRPTYAVLLLAVGALAAPIAFPILPVETFLRYTRALGLEQPHYEHLAPGRLPPFYADMFGWEERVKAAADYLDTLSAEERAQTGIFTSNYGPAGAVDFFGPRYGLPKAIGTHQNYWIWGPRQYTGESLLVMGEDDPEPLRRVCAWLAVAATPHHANARPADNVPIFHCRGLRPGLQEAWPALRKWQ